MTEEEEERVKEVSGRKVEAAPKVGDKRPLSPQANDLAENKRQKLLE